MRCWGCPSSPKPCAKHASRGNWIWPCRTAANWSCSASLSPSRPSTPEACGLRHLAFRVSDLDRVIAHLLAHQIAVEPVRVDELTGKRFTFFSDPDGLPLELYEAQC